MPLIENVFGANNIEKMNSVLVGFVNKASHLHSAVISTTDGFCLGSTETSDKSKEKLAAMSGSIYSLAKSISNEISGNGCDMLTLESGLKKIIWCTIQTKKFTLVITFVSEDNKLLGELLYSAKECCKLIQSILDDDQT